MFKPIIKFVKCYKNKNRATCLMVTLFLFFLMPLYATTTSASDLQPQPDSLQTNLYLILIESPGNPDYTAGYIALVHNPEYFETEYNDTSDKIPTDQNLSLYTADFNWMAGILSYPGYEEFNPEKNSEVQTQRGKSSFLTLQPYLKMNINSFSLLGEASFSFNRGTYINDDEPENNGINYAVTGGYYGEQTAVNAGYGYLRKEYFSVDHSYYRLSNNSITSDISEYSFLNNIKHGDLFPLLRKTYNSDRNDNHNIDSISGQDILWIGFHYYPVKSIKLSLTAAKTENPFNYNIKQEGSISDLFAFGTEYDLNIRWRLFKHTTLKINAGYLSTEISGTEHTDTTSDYTYLSNSLEISF